MVIERAGTASAMKRFTREHIAWNFEERFKNEPPEKMRQKNQVYEEMQSPAEREASTRVTQASDQRTFNLDLLWRGKPGSRAENQKKQATGCWRLSNGAAIRWQACKM